MANKRPDVRDPYTDEPVDGVPPTQMQPSPRGDDDPSGYERTKPNFVYQAGLPWASLLQNPDGSIGAVQVSSKHEIPDAERKAKAIETSKRMRRKDAGAASNQDKDK